MAQPLHPTHGAIPVLALLACILIALTGSLQAQEQVDPPELRKLRTSWKNAQTKGARPLKTTYLGDMEALKASLTKQQRLGDALLVQDEIKRLTTGAELEEDRPKGPAALAELYATYKRGLDQLHLRLEGKYRIALKGLIDTLTKQGKLESALAVKRELAALDAGVSPDVIGKPIPDDATEFQGHHYKVFRQPKISYDDARKACEELGGNLAIVDDSEEQQMLQKLKGGTNTCWVGGSDAEREGSFRWHDDSPLSRELKNVFKRENNAQCDYLFLNVDGVLGCRPNSGHALGKQFKWVNMYACEWDY